MNAERFDDSPITLSDRLAEKLIGMACEAPAGTIVELQYSRSFGIEKDKDGEILDDVGPCMMIHVVPLSKVDTQNFVLLRLNDQRIAMRREAFADLMNCRLDWETAMIGLNKDIECELVTIAWKQGGPNKSG